MKSVVNQFGCYEIKVNRKFFQPSLVNIFDPPPSDCYAIWRQRQNPRAELRGAVQQHFVQVVQGRVLPGPRGREERQRPPWRPEVEAVGQKSSPAPQRVQQRRGRW